MRAEELVLIAAKELVKKVVYKDALMHVREVARVAVQAIVLILAEGAVRDHVLGQVDK